MPLPRVNLTRFHGVFGPNSQYRAAIIIKKPDKKPKQDPKTESEKRRAMTWAQRLKRAFNIDIKVCEACGGQARVVGCIEDPVVIAKILNHLQSKSNPFLLPVNRAPPGLPAVS